MPEINEKTDGKFDRQLKFIQLKAEGYTLNSISKTLDVSKATLIEWNKQFKGQIERCKNEMLEELFQKYAINKIAYIKELGETLRKIDNEIEQKDFSDVKADKLIEMKIKCLELLKKEYVQPYWNVLDI